MATPRFLLRVLLVADNDEERQRTRQLLQKVGITSTQTSSTEAALAAAVAMKPDLIILDKDDGRHPALTVAKEIRRSSDRKIAQTPILLLTGTTDRAFIETARDRGVDAMLLKPVISTMLRQRIDAITGDARRFVRGRSYVGPCRRRRNEPAQPERRSRPTFIA